MKTGKSVKALGMGCLLLALGAASPAWAIPITLSFTADGLSGPVSTVSGSFDYDAASVTSNMITALNSVNLTIDGTTYTLGEIGATVYGGYGVIGTTADGLPDVVSFTTDFYIAFDAGSDAGFDFEYATTSSPGVSTQTFSQFSITADQSGSGTAVPEPNGLLVFLTGLAGLGGLVAHRCRPVGKVSLDWANP